MLFFESQFTPCTDEQHSYHCDVLERHDLSSAGQQHFSLVYGVNRRALLNTLTYFSVALGALIPDIMHNVLEGVLPLEVKLMLKVDYIHVYVRVLQFLYFSYRYMMDKKMFTLIFIDDGFKNLNLRYFDRDSFEQCFSQML